MLFKIAAYQRTTIIKVLSREAVSSCNSRSLHYLVLSLSYTLSPSATHSLPQLHTLSLSYTLSPSATHSLHTLSLSYTLYPSATHSLPQLHTLFLSYTLYPSATHSIPQRVYNGVVRVNNSTRKTKNVTQLQL